MACSTSRISMDAPKSRLRLEGSMGWEKLNVQDVICVLDQKPGLPSIESFICMLQKCRKSKDLASAKCLHAVICNNGLEGHINIGNHIIPMFVECGSIFHAHQAFNKLMQRNQQSWTSLILGHIQGGQMAQAFSLYEKMRQDNVIPSKHTLMGLLKACVKLKALHRGKEIHQEIRQLGFERDLFVGSTLLNMYAKCGSISEARKVFDLLPERDVVLWNALIAGYAEHGATEEAQKCFEDMRLEGISPDVVSWTTLIAGYAEHGHGQEALECFEQMRLERVSPNAATFVCCLKACSSIKAIDKGRELHLEIADQGFEQIPSVGTSLVDMYAKCSLLSEAWDVFDKLPVRDVVTWNVLIAGYVDNGLGKGALKCFERMQQEGISPNSVTFVCILKACSRMGALVKGKEIHEELKQKGFENDLFVGSTLVDMYAKCGTLEEAQNILHKLPVRDVVSWNALIAGYAEHGPGQEALNCLEQMKVEGISANSVTFIHVLKACGSIKAIDKGREKHMEIIEKGFEGDLFVGNSLVDMYAKCGFLSEARAVFDNLIVQTVVSWTTLISGYAEDGDAEEALKCFGQMHVEGVIPNAVTFVCILKACGNIGSIQRGKEIHMEIIKKGFDTDIFVGIALIDMYAKFSSMAEALEVFQKLSSRNVLLWNALIAGYAEHGPGLEALKCFEQMQMDGIDPDSTTFTSVLKACGNIQNIDKGRDIHAEIIKRNFEKDPFVGNTLVYMYAKCNSLSEAWEVFEKLPVRTVVSWNALLVGYADHGPGEEALKCLKQMQVEGIIPSPVTFTCLLKACSSIGTIEKARELHAEIFKRGFEDNPFICNALIDMYAKSGSVYEAQKLHSKLQARNVVSWNALIAGYAEHGPNQKALESFEQMQLEGVSPNTVTFLCTLKACGNMGAIDKGRKIHTMILAKGFEGDSFVGNSLVYMYAACGSLSEAQKVFDDLPIQDVVSWNAMIHGHVRNHNIDMSILYFVAMQEQRVKPNAITFICLLTACSRGSLVSKGQRYYEVMKMEYGIVPTMDHHLCMVDLLARSGHLHEVDIFLEALPCPPSTEMWTALLSACKTFGEVNLGLRCSQKLLQVNPENAVPYLLMANIYLTAGRTSEAHKIDELRKLVGAKKKPASSLIEVHNKVHEFVVGNKPGDDILAMLEILNSSMKEKGVAPKLDLAVRPVSDDDKETSLCEHAEKLAIAFGLLNTPQGQTLRVTKNLRMCDNCHDANKVISMIERREIIVRDWYCVHHFKDGLCSCSAVF